MARTAKVTISLPVELLEEVERAQQQRGETRSEFIRRALEQDLRAERARAKVEQYIRGYLEQPETPEELAETDAFNQATQWDPWD